MWWHVWWHVGGQRGGVAARKKHGNGMRAAAAKAGRARPCGSGGQPAAAACVQLGQQPWKRTAALEKKLAAKMNYAKKGAPLPSTTMRFLPEPLGLDSSRLGHPRCALPLPFCAAGCWYGGGGMVTCSTQGRQRPGGAGGPVRLVAARGPAATQVAGWVPAAEPLPGLPLNWQMATCSPLRCCSPVGRSGGGSGGGGRPCLQRWRGHGAAPCGSARACAPVGRRSAENRGQAAGCQGAAGWRAPLAGP